MAFDDVGVDLKEVLDYINQVDVIPLGQEYYSFPVPVPDKMIYFDDDHDSKLKQNEKAYIDSPTHGTNDSKSFYSLSVTYSYKFCRIITL